MNLGLIIVLIVITSYISNWLNWRYLNYKFNHFSYYIGTFIHESSHALICLVTGAKIHEFKVFCEQPHITHSKSKLPIIGNVLISLAPIFIGLFFIHLLGLIPWHNIIFLILILNIGAMLGPSFRDIKNIWPAIIILFFIHSTLLENAGITAISLILISIVVQIIAIIILKIISYFRK